MDYTKDFEADIKDVITCLLLATDRLSCYFETEELQTTTVEELMEGALRNMKLKEKWIKDMTNNDEIETNKKLVEAAKLLRDNCKKYESSESCKGCVFNDNGSCPLCNHTPYAWSILKPRRWTDMDILWAKAAKASGAVEIFKPEGSAYSVAFFDDFDDWDNAMEFPQSSFVDMKDNETVLIDEILEEAEK